MIDHPPLYSCNREELGSRAGNAFIVVFVVLGFFWFVLFSFLFCFFFVLGFLLNVDGGAFTCGS